MTNDKTLTQIEDWAVDPVLEKSFQRQFEQKKAGQIDPSYHGNNHLLVRQINTLAALISFEPEKTQIEVCSFKSMRSSEVTGKTDIESILYQIMTGGEYKNLILKARRAGKNSNEYNEIKSNLPTVTFNGTFKKRRTVENLEQLSGLLYLDIDGTTDINFDNPLIYASWRSFGNNGRGVLVKVKGMTPENIRDVYMKISHELNIQDSVDNACREISRQNVISYDPDLYVNGNSITYEFTVISEIPNKDAHKKKERRNASSLGENAKVSKIKWNNLNDYELGGKRYVYFQEKEWFVKIFIPAKIASGRRNITISALINNFLYLNPSTSVEVTQRFVLALNERCDSPLNHEEITRIYKRKFKELESGELKPIYNFPRSFIFSPEVKKDERAALVGFHLGKARSEKSQCLIIECLENWDLNNGKITNKKVADFTELCVNTVSSHMKTFKPLKDEINRVIKEGKKKSERNRGKKIPAKGV